MTAYTTAQLRNTIELLPVDGYIRKPLNVAQMRKVIREIITEREPVHKGVDLKNLEKKINNHLQSLYLNTGARFVVLVGTNGVPVQVVGPADKQESGQVAMLVASNFLAARKLTKILENNASYRSSSYETETINTYAYDINEKFLLAVVFGRETKTGLVWVYTKQAADALANIITQYPAQELKEDLGLQVEINGLRA